jgi:arginyl-tRNA synthetase
MIRQEITTIISNAISACGYDTAFACVNVPTTPSHGDYYSPVALALAKIAGKKPREIAEELKTAIGTHPLISKVDIAGPGFLNFWISDTYLSDLLSKIDQNFGVLNLHQGKKVIVEYSSPNIAKPFTIGHLRSTIIGDAIANLLETTGYEVHRDNHVGDWGTQFGKQIAAIKRWGNEEVITKSDHPVKELVNLYVKFHSEAEKDPTLEDEGRRWFKKLEEGDLEAKRLWQLCIDTSWKEFDAIYHRLGITFTENDKRGFGESYFEDKMTSVLGELEKALGAKGLYKKNDGAKLVFFPDEKYPPLMIIKKDGATLYSTRDLATDKFRIKIYGSDILIINEVGADQSLYFNQLFETEYLLGWVKPGQRVHVKHGMYRFKEGKMSTRKGNVIWLEDVLQSRCKASTLSS